MSNLDLGRYLVQHPNISRLKLVSTFPTIPVTNHRPTPPLVPARGNLTRIEPHARPRHYTWESQRSTSSIFIYRHSLFILLQRNVLVDDNGVARLGGLGSAFTLSLPASCHSDVGPERPLRDTAPELITPQAFGLVHVRITKATDMFDFGMLAHEVGRSLLYHLLLGYSSNHVGSRSSPE